MEQLHPETEIIPATTVLSMAGTWTEAENKIRTAHRLAKEAISELCAAFDGYMRIDEREWTNETPDRVITTLKREAWEAIIKRAGIRKIMSLATQREMDEQIKKGDFPDITEANILAMLESNYARINEYAEQMIREVYEWVRPHVHRDPSSYWTKYEYKTNLKSDDVGLGEKIILLWAVENGYGDREKPWRINYNKEANFTALDNAFHLLDGKGIVKSHHGPLFDAIANAGRDGKFETEYFRGKIYDNRNMHLQFKRLDLLSEFNRVAAGNRLKRAA